MAHPNYFTTPFIQLLFTSFCINAFITTTPWISLHQQQKILLKRCSSATDIDNSRLGENEQVLSQPLPDISSITGIIFDMDGTLTEPSIDFAQMRRSIYEIADSDPNANKVTRGCVLEVARSLSIDGQKRAKRVFDDIEAKSIRDMKLREGMGELMHYLDEQGIKRAILTRNVEAGVEAFHDLLWDSDGVPPFFPAVNRNTIDSRSNAIRAKPHPDGILHICRIWGCDPKTVIMVGDTPQDDIACANRAGCGASILFATQEDNCSGTSLSMDREGIMERTPTATVSDYTMLLDLVTSQT